jgi:hypothetical protein
VNDRIARYSIYTSQGRLTQYHDYIYDDNGNIIRDDQYSNNTVLKLTQSRSYEFDNKNNPYQVFACEGNPGINTNRNNIIKETSVSYNGTVENHFERLIAYEYNSLDYPVRINDLDCIYGK